MPPALIALAVATFAIGTSEFVIMGLLPDLSIDLGVSIPAAGLLVSAYALTVTFGGPVVTLFAGRLERKRALLWLIGIFITGNILCAIAPNYTLLMIARIVTALSHASFFGIGVVVAADLVPYEKRSSAIALMFSGLTLANVGGVPLGTMLGHEMGWRSTFWALLPIAILATALLVIFVKPKPQDKPSTSMLREFVVLGRPQVLLTLGMSATISIALFSVLTYIAPLLESTAGMTTAEISAVLLLFGAGNLTGVLLGGKLADRNQMAAILGVFGVLLALYLALTVTSFWAWTASVTFFLLGAATFAPGPALQTRVLDYAKDAPNVSATLIHSAFNLGNAAGAWVGGIALTAGATYAQLPWIGVAFGALALALAFYAKKLGQRSAAAS
ncbi:MFS transporter [Lacibacterium aquatile]|uniref:MFS transporter n=1 Tax=Lacibacterium aquatile TaxID=1168082 RepID=A0ABW5DRB9_9PROT